MNRISLHVGMKLYMEQYPNHSSLQKEIKECTISKIGKKYFYIEGAEKSPVNIQDLKHIHKKYSQFNFQLYRTSEEIEEMWEHGNLIYKIRKYFNTWSKLNPTLEQLRQIVKILNL